MPVKINGTGYIGTANNIFTDASGQVGIGTASPGVSLDITNDTNVLPYGQLRLNSAGAYGTRMTFVSTSTNGRMYQIGSNYWDGVGEFVIADYTAAAKRLNINSSGYVNLPSQPSFSAGLSTTWSAGSGVSTIPFASSNFNVGSCYNTSTYRFTAPVAGKYLFMCNLGSNSTTSTFTYFGILVYVNGSAVLNGWQSKALTTGSYICDSKTLMLNLSLNDYVEFKLEISGAQSIATGVVCGQLIS